MCHSWWLHLICDRECAPPVSFWMGDSQPPANRGGSTPTGSTSSNVGWYGGIGGVAYTKLLPIFSTSICPSWAYESNGRLQPLRCLVDTQLAGTSVSCSQINVAYSEMFYPTLFSCHVRDQCDKTLTIVATAMNCRQNVISIHEMRRKEMMIEIQYRCTFSLFGGTRRDPNTVGK